MTHTEWWRGAVIYQIYPRSYCDSSGDGVGDLRGVVQKLPYIADLGVDAIWICPFYPSPMKDFGYDVSDYYGVDPIFGSLDDFKALLDAAHARNIKVIVDQVWSHTADQHPWFEESRKNKTNPKADWYVWADPKPDGTPPNNWLSHFGGSAWEWEAQRQQYYLHQYLVSQPALNLHNPEVRQAIYQVARFWLDMGVDGFRLDAVHSYMADPLLRDNPARTAADGLPSDVALSSPLARQLRLYNCSRPETVEFIEEIRTWLDAYEGRVLLAEAGGEDSEALAAEYVKTGRRFHLAYAFSLLTPDYKPVTPDLIRDVITRIEKQIGDGWICWAIGNHDVPRVASRWAHEQPSLHNFRKMVLALGLSLRGSFCLYYGDELGLTEADVPFEKLQDPWGKALWPVFKGRDGCRTPMPWSKNERNAGFSTAVETWLPLDSNHYAAAVDQQVGPDSLLHHAKALIQWRSANEVMRRGAIEIVSEQQAIVSIKRRSKIAGNTEEILCHFNFSSSQNTIDLADTMIIVFASGAAIQHKCLYLEPYGYAFLATP